MAEFELQALEERGKRHSALEISATLQMLQCRVEYGNIFVSQCHVILLKNGYVSTT